MLPRDQARPAESVEPSPSGQPDHSNLNRERPGTKSCDDAQQIHEQR